MSEKVNLRPDSFAEGGGLVDDFDGILNDIRFVMTDYDGAITEAVPVARVVFGVDGEEVVQLYSVGGKNDFAPDETGMGLTVLKSKSTLTKKSKFGMLLESLVAVGFPLNKMDSGNISYLNGLEGHFLRKAVEFKGVKVREGKDQTVLACTKIISLPGEGGKTAGGRKSGGKKATANNEVAEAITGIIQSILVQNDNEMTKKDLLSALFKDGDVKALGDDKKAALKLASDDTFLKGRGEWVLADGKLMLA